MVTTLTGGHVITMSAKRGFPEVKNRELKEQAVAFYAQHNVTEALEKLLNELFLASPQDVYGYMSEYFSRLSLDPVISGLSAHEGLDGAGGKSIYVDLHCTINGVDKAVCSVSVPVDMWFVKSDCAQSTPDAASCKDKRSHKDSKSNLEQSSQKEMSEIPETKQTYSDVLSGVKKHIAPVLHGLSPRKQKEVDKAMTTILTSEGTKLHPSSLLVCSSLSAMASAQLLQAPLWFHLSSITDGRLGSKFTMPFPVVGALAGGTVGIGKLKFQEYCITSLPGSPFPEQIKMLGVVHAELKKAIVAKYGPTLQGSLANGAYCPAIDKPEQGLDLIQDAAKNAKLELDENIGVFIVVGAERLYDQSKGKYELVAGQWKSSDEVINLYSDLLQSYPGLVGYIDPLHHQDLEGWKKLQEKLGSKCLLVADNTLKMGLAVKSIDDADTLLEARQGPESSSTEVEGDKPATSDTGDEAMLNSLSCAGLSFEPTLSAMMDKTALLKSYTSSGYVMMRVPQNMAMNTIAADMAVALHCRFIRLGAPSGMTSCALLSRLLHIREELVARKLHEPAKAHLFSCSLQAEEQQTL